MVRLGVNIDHVATLRQARGGREPDPIAAAVLAELAGADGITVHLREDRRHIQDRDLRLLRETVQTRLNLESAVSSEMVAIAIQTRPDQVTLVPERRQEVTTEGGLDVAGQLQRVRDAVSRLHEAGLSVSLFIDPDRVQVDASLQAGADAVELHTGRYALARGAAETAERLRELEAASAVTTASGMSLHAGHGLNYLNTPAVAAIAGMHELNIGHSIVSRAVLAGLETAVREMKAVIRSALRSASADHSSRASERIV